MINRIFKVKDGEESVEKNIKFIMGVLTLIKNKKRRKILSICYESPKTVSELNRLIKANNKFTWYSVRDLEKYGLVKIEKTKGQKYNAVYIKSLTMPSEITNLFMEFLDTNRDKFNAEYQK